MQLLRRRPVEHPPEFDRAAPSALELDDHIQLLPVLRAEIVLRNLPATRDLALDHEIAALPVALDLDIPASIHYLSDLAAVVVERSEEHTCELQSQSNLVCRLLLEKKKTQISRSGLSTPRSKSSRRRRR